MRKGQSPTPYTDAELLHMLTSRADGASFGQIAKNMGRTRNAVAAILLRIASETTESEHDGTMPKGWWRAGLAKQGCVDA